MKKIILVGFIFLFYYSGFTQNLGEWVWLHGDSAANSTGNNGIKGIPSPLNKPPPLYEPCEWVDLNGNFWIFGGWNGMYGQGDLWKYDVIINEWTWMEGGNSKMDTGNYGIQGVPSPTNSPPYKGWGTASWVDLNGNLWMFGGANGYNDLWKYDISNNQWTWMKGAKTVNSLPVYGIQGVPNITNDPGGRWECAARWVDKAGDLWFFGGFNTGQFFNDLWRYNIATNTWTWMKGSNINNQPGIYGIKGVENSANVPSSRTSYSNWKDNNGNFWIFGGWDCMSVYHNDVWRYNPVTNNWTWMNGDTVYNYKGNYGTKCNLSPKNVPTSRFETRTTWTDQNGNLWLFGGADGGNFQLAYNDLWMYCISENQWKWVGGEKLKSPKGNWGIKGLSSPSNVPCGRAGAVGWMDQKGHLYVFGGSFIMLSPTFKIYNDLWKYTIDTCCSSCYQSLPIANFTSSDSSFCSEPVKCISFFDHSTITNCNANWKWFFPGAVPDSSQQQNPTNICYYTPGIYAVTLIVGNGSSSDTLTVSPMITVGSTPSAPTITNINGTLYCSLASSYQWYFNGVPISGATDSSYYAANYGSYNVEITDSIGCSRLGNGVLASISELNNLSEVQIFPNPAYDELSVSFNTPLKEDAELAIIDMLGKVLNKKLLERSLSNKLIPLDELANGIYILQIHIGMRVVNKKFVVLKK